MNLEVDEEITPEQRARLQRLLLEYEDVFAKHPKRVKSSLLPKHHIDTRRSTRNRTADLRPRRRSSTLRPRIFSQSVSSDHRARLGTRTSCWSRRKTAHTECVSTCDRSTPSPSETATRCRESMLHLTRFRERATGAQSISRQASIRSTSIRRA